MSECSGATGIGAALGNSIYELYYNIYLNINASYF